MNGSKSNAVRVLYVDDDAQYCELAKIALERESESIEVVTETSASAGLDRLLNADRPIDCIASDYKMADMDGLEFLKAVREHCPDLPFILVTGKGSEHVASEAISVGVTDYLPKHLTEDIHVVLANRIENAVAQYRAEQARRESERRYRQLVEDSPHAVFVYQDRELVYANESMVELLNADNREQLYGSDATELVDPDFRSTSAASASSVLEIEGDRGWQQTQIVRFDGEIRDVEIKKGAITYDGEPAHQVVLRDITERKQRDRERKQIIDRVTDAIVKVDEEWRFTLVDDRAEEIYDMNEEDLLGRDFWDVFVEARDTKFEEEYRRVMETRESTSFEAYYTGLESWFRVHVYPDDDGGLSFYFRDISERKEREEELKELTSRLQLALEGTNTGVWEWDLDTDELLWDEQVERLFGYEPGESPNTYEAFVDRIHPEDFDKVEAAHERGLKESDYEAEFRVVIDDETKRWVNIRAEVLYEDGAPHSVVGIATDITNRKQQERQLTTLHHVTQDLIQATSKEEVADIAVAAAEDILDLPATAIYSTIGTGDEFHSLAQTTVVAERFEDPRQRLDETAAEQALVTQEGMVRADLDDVESPIRSELLLPLGDHGVFAAGSTTHFEFDEADRSLATILAANTRAALARTERERAVTQLHETTDELLHAETKDDISQLIVDTAYIILDLSSVAIYLFDEDEGVLCPAATSPDVEEIIGEPPTFTPGDGIAWNVFIEEHQAIYDDVREADDVYNPDTPMRSELLIPLGDHGVFIAGSTKEAAFTDEMVELAELLARNAEAALDRARREQQVKEHERQLQERTAQLRRLNQLNELLRDVNQALVRAETREEIEHTICEYLVKQEFTFAWIATPDHANDRLTPQAWAGTEGNYLDRVSTAITDANRQKPTVKAARTEEVTIVDNISQNFRSEEWRKKALTHGFRSVASIPLVYDDVFFGVLSVYTKRPEFFDGIPTAILRELGETIGYAINTVERKQTFLSDRSVEFEFEITDPDCLALQLARQSDSTLAFESVIPQADNAALAFVTVPEGSPDRVLELEEDSVVVDHARLLEGDNDVERVELRLSTLPAEAKLLDHGAILAHSTADRDTYRVAIEVPTSTDVQSVVEFISNAYADIELVARREHESADGENSNPSGLVEPLTERQHEVVQAAYYAGYFNWPRDSTAEELAESLDVSSATVHHHLRKAQRKLAASLVDSDRRKSVLK